jgi:hypothetical protein
MAKNEAQYGSKGKEPLRSSKYGKSVPIPSQNLHIDPKGKSSFRGKGVYIAQGDKVTIRGTGGKGSSTKARKQTATWF